MSFWTDGISLGPYGWFWIAHERKINYTNWASSAPNNKANLCIQLYFVLNKGLFWNSVDCYSKSNFVCEFSDYGKNQEKDIEEEMEDSSEEITNIYIEDIEYTTEGNLDSSSDSGTDSNIKSSSESNTKSTNENNEEFNIEEFKPTSNNEVGNCSRRGDRKYKYIIYQK